MSTTETKVRHTPGPWKLTRTYRNNTREQVGVYSGNCAAIAEVHLEVKTGRADGVHPLDENLANAALIAAAPDILEALERLTTLVGNMRELYQSNPAGKWLTDSEAYSVAIAAIAKAKGGA